MKKFIITFIISTILLLSCNKKDNIKNNVNEDINSLFNKAKDLRYNRKERIQFLNKIYFSFENKKYNDSLKNDYFMLSELYYENNLKENQLKTFKKILQRAENSKDSDGIIKTNCSIGSYYIIEFIGILKHFDFKIIIFSCVSQSCPYEACA